MKVLISVFDFIKYQILPKIKEQNLFIEKESQGRQLRKHPISLEAEIMF